MKRLLFVMMMIAAASVSVRAADQPKPSEPAAPGAMTNGVPKIQFDKTIYDFGTTSLVQQLSGTFIISNAGSALLTISKPTTSCGCTVPSYPKTPIRAGETGTIKVAFNSNGKRGFQNKNILVVANTQPNTTVIRIKAQVVNPGTEK